MQKETEIYYEKKIRDVLNYIHNHLSDELNVKLLSEHFGISFFHFHRILKAYLNEPLGSYINRVRLETAVKLIRYSDAPLSEIATRIGYSDCSAFSKAFSKEFGISPQQYKSNKSLVLNTHVDYRINDVGKLVSDTQPKIVLLSDRAVIYTKFKGEYGCKEFNMVWNDFWQFITLNKILSWKPDVFTVYYDDPFETLADECRAEFCVATNKHTTCNNHIETKILPGGKYAMFKFKGPHDRLMELYKRNFSEWLFHSNFKVRNSPFIEKYLNDYHQVEPNSLLTEIFIPID